MKKTIFNQLQIRQSDRLSDTWEIGIHLKFDLKNEIHVRQLYVLQRDNNQKKNRFFDCCCM